MKDVDRQHGMHTQECFDYAKETMAKSGVAYCIASCADARSVRLASADERLSVVQAARRLMVVGFEELEDGRDVVLIRGQTILALREALTRFDTQVCTCASSKLDAAPCPVPSHNVGGVEAGVAQSQQRGGGDIAAAVTARAPHPKEQRERNPPDPGSSPGARFDSTQLSSGPLFRYFDIRCHECGEMMTSHAIVTRHAKGGCDEAFAGPPLPPVECSCGPDESAMHEIERCPHPVAKRTVSTELK